MIIKSICFMEFSFTNLDIDINREQEEIKQLEIRKGLQKDTKHPLFPDV